MNKTFTAKILIKAILYIIFKYILYITNYTFGDAFM